MKRVFLIMVLLLSVFVNAQGIKKAKGIKVKSYGIKFGIKGGLNMSDLFSSHKAIKFDSKTVYHAGAVLEIVLGNQFALQPEIVYSAQGADFEQKIKGIKTQANLKFDYIAVPIMAKFFVLPGFSIDAGPQISFNVNSKVEAKILGVEKTIDIKDYINSYDFSLCFGLGYEFERVGFSARYNLGLKKVFKDVLESDSEIELDEIFDSEKLRSGVFQFSLVFFF